MQGTCLCGAIGFEVDGPYPKLYQCHCSLCRKQGGSVSNTGLIVAADKFRWLAGEVLISTWTRETGFRSYFCCAAARRSRIHCGHGLHLGAERVADGDEPLEIAAQLYIDSRAPWDQPPSGGLHLQYRAGLGELIALLHLGST
jgi:hypothetical protein